MPIQIVQPGTIFDVQRAVGALEVKFAMTSEEFLHRDTSDSGVPEFDALEWNFLLSQKKALEDDCVIAEPFYGRFTTSISPSALCFDPRGALAA